MVEEDRNVLLKSIDTGLAGLKEAIKGMKKGDDVSELQKSVGELEIQLGTVTDQTEMVKTLEGEKVTLETDLQAEKDKIVDLQKTIDSGKEEADKKAHDALISTALDLAKDLDAKTEVKDEDAYIVVLSKSFSEEEIKTDVDACIKTDIKAMEIAKTHIPEGSLPGQEGNNPDDEIDEDAQRAKDLRKKLKEEGFLAKTEGDE